MSPCLLFFGETTSEGGLLGLIIGQARERAVRMEHAWTDTLCQHYRCLIVIQVAAVLLTRTEGN
jgi:hypothetical protein